MMTVAPAATASSTWDRWSHSTSTMRPGHSGLGPGHGLADGQPGQVVVLDQHGVGQAPPVVVATAGPDRGLLEGPEPGVVLRVSSTRVAGLAARTASTYRRVREATPDRCPRKLSTVRSAVRMERREPMTSATRSPGATAAPSPIRQATSRVGSICWKASSAQARPAITPASRLTMATRAVAVAGTGRRGQVAQGQQVLGQGPGHRVDHRTGGAGRRRPGPAWAPRGPATALKAADVRPVTAWRVRPATATPSRVVDDPPAPTVGGLGVVTAGVGPPGLAADGGRAQERRRPR